MGFQVSAGTIVVILMGILTIVTTESLSLKLLQNKVPVTMMAKKSTSSLDHKIPGPRSGDEANSKQARQYGWGWSPSYTSGSYDIYTLIAVAAFAALFGALFFELATGGTFRSMGSSFNLPFVFDNEQFTDLVSKVSNFISDIDWDSVVNNATKIGAKSRALRSVSEQTGVLRWIKAYKKDPFEYQCVRKVACETLAESSLVARSMKSPFSGIVLSTVGMFIEHGEELQSIVKDTIGNPDKCKDIAPWGFCDENDDTDA